MAYYREEETKYAMENLVRWNGDGASVRCSMSILDILRSELTRQPGPAIPTLGVEAARTRRALDRMEERAARALILYHTTPHTAEHNAGKLGVSRRTFFTIVQAAHLAYWAAVDAVNVEIRQSAAMVDSAREYHAAAIARPPVALASPSADLPRLGTRKIRRKAT